MSVISADGLSLLVGDGQGSEQFFALAGARLMQLEITQTARDVPAIAGDAWAVQSAVTNRKAVVEVEAMATDAAAALRVRSLALLGIAGNFRLEMRGSETMNFTALVRRYREYSDAGGIKQLQVQLESTGTVTVV